MAWEQRETPTGFLQFRETGVDENGKRWRHSWQFQIYGFSGEPGTLSTCSVYAVEGKRECPIDARNRLKIEDRWYSSLHWNH